jgi:hypothetical protein
MADGPHREETPEGCVESVHGGEVTPSLDPDNKVGANERIQPNPRLEQLWARQQKLEDMRLQLEEERVELEREISCHGEGERVRAMARDVYWRIIKIDDSLSHFARASQNIAVTAALL